jgi:two-component system, cell cycle sensor histidine kinase and response regulator CckA
VPGGAPPGASRRPPSPLHSRLASLDVRNRPNRMGESNQAERRAPSTTSDTHTDLAPTSSAAFKALFDASPLPLILTDEASGDIVAANRLAETLSGLTGDQLKTRSVFDFGQDLDPATRARQAEALGRSPGEGREVRITTPAGLSLRLLAHTSRIATGGHRYLLTAFTNVTSLGRLDEGMLAAQRMEVVGKLAGGVAHEFNNLLTVMQGHLDALAEEAASAPAVTERLAALGRAVGHATRITSGLLTFSGRNPTAAAAIDLNQALDGLRSLISGTLGETISIAWDLTATPATARIADAQLAQVVLNLALNAREAMPEGGRIGIGTAYVTEPPPGARTAGPWVLLRVDDNGHGMDDDVRRQAFEPFFTTKGPGRGTGLGLPICQGIAEQAGGFITIDSTVGAGTSVRVYLPWVAASSVAGASNRPIASPSGATASRGKVILLVEDEADVRHIVAEILRRAGHTVHAVDGVASAEVLVDQLAGPLDLLLSDLVLPGANGLEVARRVRARHPHIPVLFMSGYSESVFAGDQPVEHLIQKPFTSRGLLDTLEALLSRSS